MFCKILKDNRCLLYNSFLDIFFMLVVYIYNVFVFFIYGRKKRKLGWKSLKEILLVYIYWLYIRSWGEVWRW